MLGRLIFAYWVLQKVQINFYSRRAKICKFEKLPNKKSKKKESSYAKRYRRTGKESDFRTKNPLVTLKRKIIIAPVS